MFVCTKNTVLGCLEANTALDFSRAVLAFQHVPRSVFSVHMHHVTLTITY